MLLTYIQAPYIWIKASLAKITYAKYLLGVITVGFTAAVLPLFRFIAKAKGGNISKAADATYWVLSCIFGIGILIYPWWLATAKSPLYYSRLQYYGRIISTVILLLAGIQGVFNPEHPFDKNHPDATSLAYRVVSSLNIITILGGLLILLPILIRRDRLFQSNSQALFRFAWVFALIMIVGMVLNRCAGDNRIVSYSCVVIILQFGVCDYLEALERKRNGRVGIFDEAYIIIAGFVPFWIAFAVGGTLLEIVSQSGSTGTVFVYVSWRMIIYAFEYMAGEVGRKASRYSDGSVFSYSAIYTGATFANFIFLSVEWNSGTFWALLLITALNIVVVNGGLMIDLDYWFVDYFAVSEHWPRLYHLKVLYYEICREMPTKLAIKIAKCGSNPSPEVQLALIRSRAKFLQLNWVHNDIKMSSEFQALACACTAVGMEMVYSYYNVGADSITANSVDRRDILSIFCVQVLFVFCAQAIARRRLRHKVSRLKREISQTVKALEGFTNPHSKGRRRSVSTGGITGATDGAANARPKSVRRGSMLSALASALTGGNYSAAAQSDVEQGGVGDVDEGEQDDELLISGTEVDADALNAILGLCSLYAGDSVDADSSSTSTKASPVRSNLPFATTTNTTANIDSSPKSKLRFGPVHFNHHSPATQSDDDAQSEDDWGEVQLTNSRQSLSDHRGHGAGGFQKRVSGLFFGQRRGSTRSTNTSSVRMQGYLNKRKPGTNSTYQRRFFVLTDRQLMWFASEEDVETHINRRKGAVNTTNISNLDRYDPTSLCIINVTVHGRVYILLASDRTMADEWYDMIQSVRDSHKTHHLPSPDDFEEQPDADETEAGNSNMFPWFTGAIAAAQSRHSGRHSGRAARPASRQSISMVGGFSSLLGFDTPAETATATGSSASGHVSRAMRRGTMGIGNFFVAAGSLAQSTSDAVEFTGLEWKSSWQVRDLPVKMGYIQKKGELNSSWQHRWFVMDGSGVLSWFEKAGWEHTQKARGDLPVWEISSVKPVDSDAPRVIILIHIHGRVYELEACSEIDANDWRQILEKWVSSAHTAVEKYHLEQGARDVSISERNGSEHHQEIVQEVPFLAQHARRKEGFMQKRGGFNSDWRRRWFELDDYVLSWFERSGLDSSKQRFKGSLQLNEVLCIKTRSHDAPCLVEVVHTQGRTYELEAESGAEAEDWRLQLNLWLREAYSVAKSAQLGLCSGSHYQAPMTDHSLPRTDRTNSSTSDSAQEIESAKLEATKNRYFMYSNWGLKNKTAKKNRKEERNAYGTLSLPALPDLESGESREEVKSQEEVEPDEPHCFTATETIEALSRQHAVVSEVASALGTENTVWTNHSRDLPSRVDCLGDMRCETEDDDIDQCVSSTPFISAIPFTAQSCPGHKPFSTAASILAHSQMVSDLVNGSQNEGESTNTADSPLPDLDERSLASSIERAGSPSFSRLYATIAAASRDESPLQVTENPGPCRTPRRTSTYAEAEASIEQRKRGFTTSVPVSQLRRQAKRQNILSSQAIVAQISPDTNRRESELADTKFMHRMAKRHSSELVDNLQKRSYKDLNAEFWDTHWWYLACVVCFVTLNVLYATSYIVNRYE